MRKHFEAPHCYAPAALRIVALAFAASLLLTACAPAGAAPSAPQNAVSAAAPSAADQSEVSTPQNAANGNSLTLIRGEGGMLRNAQDGLYVTITPQYDGVTYMTFYDYNTLEQRYLCSVPGCAHSGESCGAFIKTRRGSSILPVLVGDALYYLYDAYPDPAKPETEWVAAVERRKPDGSEPQLVAQGSVWQEFTGGLGLVYTDGAALYVISNTDGNGRILRIDLETGACTDVPWDNFGLRQTGACVGRSLIALDPPSGDPLAPVSLCAIDVDTGNKTVLHTWEGKVFGFLTETLQNGKLIYVNLTTRELWAYDPATDTEELFTDAFTQYGESTAYGAMYWRALFAGDWIFMRNIGGNEVTKLWAHNLNTKEMKEVTLTDVQNTQELPMQMHMDTPHGLLVTQETRPLTFQATDDTGATMTAQTTYSVLALIDPADFAASIPNFRTLRPLQQAQ